MTSSIGIATPFTLKQKEFILNANRKYNLAHGAVRAGKTVASLFRFMQQVMVCPGNSIFIIGYSLSTIYRNVVSLLFDSPELKFFAPLCSWSKGEHTLLFGPKRIKCIGAGDEGALGIIQGLTIDLCYCDEMTLYPDNVIDMIDTRLSRDHSMIYASMNPKQPDHKLKKWIDKAEGGNPLYYSLHFSIDDNTFLSEAYKNNLRENLTGLFYKRNYLGQWCMAEGAIFEFFDRKIHTREEPTTAAEYYIAGIDWGARVFACVLIGVNSGRTTQTGKKMWVEKEYYWDVEQTKRQKVNSEFVRDLQIFFDGYPLKAIYIDPSALAFKIEMQRAGFRMVDGNNEVLDGIQVVAMLMNDGTLSILKDCRNLIKEIEAYVWDEKKSKVGRDAPLKQMDHAVDALRYAIYTHKVSTYKENVPPPMQGRLMI